MVRRRVLLLSTVLLAGTATAVAGGCSPGTRHRILSTLFEGVPAEGEARRPKPVVRSPRRPPVPRASPSPRLAEAPAEPPAEAEAPPLPTWEALSGRLPKDAAGGVDWVRALREKAIEPKPGLGPEAEEQPVFPLDVELVPEGQPLFKVTFPHRAHTELLACTNCHPGIFQMQAGADPITMAAIFAGEYCGRCHGKVAFDVATGCPRCHLAMGGGQ